MVTFPAATAIKELTRVSLDNYAGHLRRTYRERITPIRIILAMRESYFFTFLILVG